jgi:two-component system sensor histidine kinase AlgZ
METGPRLSTVIREAMAAAPRETRRTAAFGVIAWLGLIALQAFDSANAPGAVGASEFLSAVCGSAGGLLFIVGHLLEASASARAGTALDAPRTEAFRRLLIALPAIALASASLLAAAIALMIVRGVLGAPLVFVTIVSAAFAAVLVLSARSAVRACRLLYSHARAEASRAAAARAEAAEAGFAALQARMNPHFLFNALNTVAALIRTDPAAAERATEDLSDVLRLTLERTADRMSTLDDEITYVRAYLAVEQQRFGDRLRVEWDIPPDAAVAPVPTILLQPLVENAIRYGAGARVDGVTIRISAASEPGAVRLRVDDTGPGFGPAWREGNGLGNLRQRLVSLYGDRAAVEVDRTAPGGHVRVKIPVEAAARP